METVASYDAYFLPVTSAGPGNNGILFVVMSPSQSRLMRTDRSRKERHRHSSIHKVIKKKRRWDGAVSLCFSPRSIKSTKQVF